MRKLILAVLEFMGASCKEISVYFVTEEVISELHDQFFQDPSPTDCISFPLESDAGGGQHLGEIFVCPAVAIAYAKRKNLDPYQETALYVVHGLLHLLGFDDLDEKEKRIMRKKEKSCMGHLSKLEISMNPR